MHARRTVLAPLGVYAASRLLVLVATELAASAGRSTAPLLTFLTQPWDAIHYVDIAEHGYPAHLTHVDGHVGTSLHAFFPLYPLLTRAVAALTPLGVPASAVLLSLVTGAVAVVLLRQVADHLAGPDVADWSVLLFCFAPGSFALGWSASEGPMLMFAIGAVLLLLRDRPWPAAALLALATATRPNAVTLVLAVAWLAWSARRLRHLAVAVLGGLGFLAVHAYFWALTGEPRAWFRVQREGFGEGVRPAHRLLEVLFEEYPAHPRQATAQLTWLLLGTAVGLVVVVARSRVVPVWLRVYAVTSLVLAIVSNTGPASPRLQLVAFPAFVAVAALRRIELRSLALAGSSMLLVVLVIAYSNPTGPPFYMWAP